MQPLTEILRHTLRARLTLRRDAPIVVAVSGGADSVALLAALSAEGYPCVAAHCNFHLRGEESLRDMRFVEELTERLGVDLYVKDFDVPAAMAATGESVEMACRRLRYDWFDELLTSLRGSDVAVGHHREDNVETFFLNLARGTGIAGLTGMSYRRGNVVRPLLDCSRAQIEQYLAACGLDYVTDSTNAGVEYRRNRLRNRLLPLFEEMLPGALEGVERTMAMLGDARAVYDRTVESIGQLYGNLESGCIKVASLSAEPDARVLLFELLRPAGFTMTQVENILAAPERSGATFKSPASAWMAELSHGELRLHCGDTSGDEKEYEVSLEADIQQPVELSVQRLSDAGSFAPEASADVLYMDAKALEGNPRWVLRHWRRGDRLRPFGMSGSKLVSDLFADAKMTASQKRSAWLLLRNDRIVWVLGVRTSAWHAVGKSTREYLRVVYAKHTPST